MIAIVGGRGVIGAAIAGALRAAGHEVVVVTHDPRVAERPGFRHGDMLRTEGLDGALAGADVVFQSANFKTYPVEKPRRGQTFMAFDGEGTERLVAAARAAGARRYVFISGVGTRPDAGQPYFRAIWRGEQAVFASGLEAVAIRPAFVFGPRDRGLNRILAFARRSPVVPVIGDGRQLEQPVYVDDVAEVARRCVPAGSPEGVFEVGGPERMTLDEMLATALRLAGLRRRILHLPRGLVRLGAAALEKLPGPPLTRAAVDFLSEDFVARNERLEATFDVSLTPFAEGLRRYLG